ncbi:MAG: HAMP domain-containing protein [Chloroflexi bacterium]|nr:HAMP domain-containing protein [Chloroflexota bacterium]
MSLRRKAQLVVVVTLIALVLILYLTLRTLLLYSFTQLETQATKRNVERLLNIVSDDFTQLSSTNADYAFWDDTYSFVETYNANYASQYTDASLLNLGINVMVWLNPQGEKVFEQSVNFDTMRSEPLPRGLEAYLTPDSPLIPPPGNTTGFHGILLLAETPLMVTSKPILTSDKQGPPTGTLIFGRYLDDGYVQHLSNALRDEVKLYRLDDPQLPADYRDAAAGIHDDTVIVTRATDESWVQGYTILRDPYGQPALILRVNMSRDIYAQGRATLSYFFAALVFVGLVFMVMTTLLLEGIVLRPVAYLSQRITHIRNRADPDERIFMEGQDELARLAHAMNGMLDALAKAQQELKIANQELENRVLERTAELMQTNARLEQEIVVREQSQMELVQARDQALEALRLKAQILANISHDARTPLTVIMLRTEMLQKEYHGPLNDRQREMLDSIQLNARQLLIFFNNLLNEAQMKAARLKLKNVPFSPIDLLQNVNAAMCPLAERKGLYLTTEISPDLPPLLRGDPEKLGQILTNLVENAIKFTNQGSVRVRLFKADPQHWALEVTDTGCGIPVEAQSHIFEAFWQVDGSITREVNQGVGLGLSIVRQLATLMGGQTSVRSQIGQGSTFTITLPLFTAEVTPS